ncbi:MAG: hypothetical protein AABW49_02745 [Nanoarchaeota archaeon]
MEFGYDKKGFYVTNGKGVKDYLSIDSVRMEGDDLIRYDHGILSIGVFPHVLDEFLMLQDIDSRTPDRDVTICYDPLLFLPVYVRNVKKIRAMDNNKEAPSLAVNKFTTLEEEVDKSFEDFSWDQPSILSRIIKTIKDYLFSKK